MKNSLRTITQPTPLLKLKNRCGLVFCYSCFWWSTLKLFTCKTRFSFYLAGTRTPWHLIIVIIFSSASQLAFDQYGQLSAQLETESALRERAESVATQVLGSGWGCVGLGTGSGCGLNRLWVWQVGVTRNWGLALWPALVEERRGSSQSHMSLAKVVSHISTFWGPLLIGLEWPCN